MAAETAGSGLSSSESVVATPTQNVATAAVPSSASASASASAAAVTPQNPSDTAIDSSGHFRGVPTAVRPFFANPFVTPFMPQQSASMLGSPGHAEAANGGDDYHSTPLPSTDAFFVQGVQYQEMMQQYIQSLMAAAAAFPQSTELSNQDAATSEGAWDARNAVAAFPMLLQQMQQHLSFGGPFSHPGPSGVFQPGMGSPSNTPSAGSKLERSGRSSVSDGADVGNAHFSATSSSSGVADAAVCESDVATLHDGISGKEPSTSPGLEGDAEGTSISLLKNGEVNELEGEPKTSTEVGGLKSERRFEGTADGIASADGSPVNATPSGSASPPSSSEHAPSSARSATDSAVPPSAAGECRTSVLIKKQMNEIDREINRRIQNKNIKKAALPFGSTGETPKGGENAGSVKPSLNQLKDAYGGVQTRPMVRSMHQALYQNHFPQQTGGSPSSNAQSQSVGPQTSSAAQHGTGVPPCTGSPFAHPSSAQFPPYFPPSQAAMFFPGAQQEVTPQLAAAFLQQFQQSQQMGMFAGNPFPFSEPAYPPHPAPPSLPQDAHRSVGSSQTRSSPAVASACIPPPPAAPSASTPTLSTPHNGHPGASDTSAGEQHWREESGWNEIGARHKAGTANAQPGPTESTEEGEPIWVMRDSYLKRIQREEDRSNESVEAQRIAEKAESAAEENVAETERLLAKGEHGDDETRLKKASKKEVIVHEPAVLIEGVLFRARYLGSTQLICEGRPTKTSRMMQAQEAVARVKAPAGEIQPSTDIDLFISTEKIMVLNTDLQDILMDHALRTISYIADIGDLVVLMARRMSQSASEEECTADGLESIRRAPRVICHVFESDEASFIAQSIGQAFQVAYVEFLRANGIDDPSYLREIDYQEVLNSQELMGEELEMFARRESQKDVVVPKKAGEPLGVVVVESGWGSMLPTVVIANLQPGGAASRCNQLNIGDQIIAINGISLVGLPLASAQQNIKGARSSTAVKLTVVSTPPVVEVRIKRPDTKYQLGFSVQNGVICSLLRGGIAERGGIRVGHRIIEINSQSVVAVAHEKIVNMLATAIGEIHMKTMPTSMFRLLTGQEVPNYI